MKMCLFASSALVNMLMVAAMTFAFVAPAAAEDVVASSGKIKVETLSGLDHPWKLALLPDDRLLVTEKPGNLRVFDNGKLSDPIAGVPKVAYQGQGGLLGLILDPDFNSNSKIYFSYSEPAEEQPPASRDPGDPRIGSPGEQSDVTLKGLAVASARLDGKTLKDVKVIWRQEPKMIGRGHFGGQLLFAPDGKLIITSGERQRFDPAQDPTSNAGKIVRINKDGSIPDDNPFVSDSSQGRADVWSIGHRNPLGVAVEPKTKNLWVHEMGPFGGDELNLIEKGANYGWPIVSNGDHYDKQRIPDHATRPEFKPPVVTWTPVISPAGIIFYAGNLFNQWTGKALIGGLSSEALVVVSIDGGEAKEIERVSMGFRVRDVIEARDGSLYVLKDEKDKDNGALLRLTPARQQARD